MDGGFAANTVIHLKHHEDTYFMRTSAIAAAVSEPPIIIRYTIVALVVGFYIGLGYLLHPDTNTYLLLGMPITIIFQLVIARRPLRELWLRHGHPVRFDWRTAAWLLLFLVGPIQTSLSGASQGNVPIVIYGLVALLGAAGAAVAFRVLGAANLRQLGLLLVMMAGIGLALLLLRQSGARAQDLALGKRLLVGIQSLLFYIPAVFVAEEVFFRGALDTYLHRGETGAGWASAAFVSVLWGLWHMPIVDHLSMIVVLQLVGAQLIVGLVLSWAWRTTGNLAMPGTIHAIIDAMRNAVLL
jgi:membrane protease YdiL (CAAX protease family)